MSHILVATDSDDVAEETFSALAAFGTTGSRGRKGQEVRPVVKKLEPDLVILQNLLDFPSLYSKYASPVGALLLRTVLFFLRL